MTTRRRSSADPDDDFAGLAQKLMRDPMSVQQADARVASLLEKAVAGTERTLVVDPKLPAETIIRVQGRRVTVSRDVKEALDRHQQRDKAWSLKRTLKGRPAS